MTYGILLVSTVRYDRYRPYSGRPYFEAIKFAERRLLKLGFAPGDAWRLAWGGVMNQAVETVARLHRAVETVRKLRTSHAAVAEQLLSLAAKRREMRAIRCSMVATRNKTVMPRTQVVSILRNAIRTTPFNRRRMLQLVGRIEGGEV